MLGNQKKKKSCSLGLVMEHPCTKSEIGVTREQFGCDKLLRCVIGSNRSRHSTNQIEKLN